MARMATVRVPTVCVFGLVRAMNGVKLAPCHEACPEANGVKSAPNDAKLAPCPEADGAKLARAPTLPFSHELVFSTGFGTWCFVAEKSDILCLRLHEVATPRKQLEAMSFPISFKIQMMVFERTTLVNINLTKVFKLSAHQNRNF